MIYYFITANIQHISHKIKIYIKYFWHYIFFKMATFLSQLADYQYIFFYLNALTVEEKLKQTDI